MIPPETRATGSLTLELLTRSEELHHLATDWDGLARESGASVFHTAAWVQTWWEAFGHGRSLRALVVRSGGQLAGILPLCLDRTRSGARRLRAVGSPEADYGGVLVHPHLWESAVEFLADALYGDRGWDVLWLPQVPEACQATRLLLGRLREKGCRVVERRSWCYRVRLPASWEEYLETLSRPTRRRLLQKARRLLELDARADRADACGQGVDDFAALHTRQWARRGQSGAFASPGTLRFHRLLAEALAARGWLDLWWLKVGETVQAAVYDFRFGRSVYSYLSAVNPDGLLRLSPGLVLTLWRIRAAIEDGYADYDLLRGDEPYKESLGAQPYPTSTYLVGRPGRWRAWWYLALAPLRDALTRREGRTTPEGGAGPGRHGPRTGRRSVEP
ncbi:MAG: GNAT family N-acetyltransferase [Armatimonadota bacterium]|nr:GNAT family N-acetyltransferase [Armatimonadota bacterium]MDR7413411.1 GNAT family N-acetyltransferase [Armatimonadota bacterium]MDR7447231.1 GNAT family N-acetyltransferase [Armatimonadota bacterium]MDR7529946.1 GNAT family N-acetyltransferase [Armatimonadota bacterium]MDR7564906.1 GNAT family N-acetyltransferase [Armatimonadota bacterium]